MCYTKQAPSCRILINGRVQGLGFRPYVYRLAVSMGITGTVSNTDRGVQILAQGKRVAEFVERLKQNPPRLALVAEFSVRRIWAPKFPDFSIRPSTGQRPTGIDVLPDLATCPDCADEILDPKNRRFSYAFTNCTQCGPRYTIIESLPYDRTNTTMRSFRMCPDCNREYQSPADRRFHAQPNACPICGPQLRLLHPDGKPYNNTQDPLTATARAIALGKVVAIKSLGGFQLACDAENTRAVRLLRKRKARPAKPFAVMCEDLAVARLVCRVNPTEAKLLTSPAAPIVLLAKSRRAGRAKISPSIAPGNSRLGIMLACTPLHILLFRALRKVRRKPVILVMTSANPKGSPIASTEQELVADLGDVVDLILTHDRPIANRCDDSVVMTGTHMEAGHTDSVLPVRLARGYVPLTVELSPMFHVKHPTLAVGADSKNAFCLASGNRAYVSQHIGDMGSEGTERFFLEALDRLMKLTGIKPAFVVCDLHPDYFSTRLAQRLSAKWGAKLIRVQHHYAHILSVAAEYGLHSRTLGIALDGTGYGTDGAVWGCEIILVEPDLAWRRVGHLSYMNLPLSGELVPDPTKIARAYRVQIGQGHRPLPGQFVPCSSIGRLFDAVAAITGICRHASFEGQAAIALEAAAAATLANTHDHPLWYNDLRTEFRSSWSQPGPRAPDTCLPTSGARLGPPNIPLTIDARALLRRVLEDIRIGLPPDAVAARFHCRVNHALTAAATRLARAFHVRTVILSGGALQNSVLRAQLRRGFARAKLRILFNRLVPANDGGICLGQVAAAHTGATRPKD
ncbi:MAG: carbamoyltransferase HypF [candidate division WOR-3 bacterium]